MVLSRSSRYGCYCSQLCVSQVGYLYVYKLSGRAGIRRVCSARGHREVSVRIKLGGSRDMRTGRLGYGVSACQSSLLDGITGSAIQHPAEHLDGNLEDGLPSRNLR